jgi:sensor c-di-GMP phosphodiesterase-like protein
MSLIDIPLPADTTVAVLESESGHLMVHSDPLPKSLLQAAWKLREGELRQDGYLVEISSSEDSRTVDLAARPLTALEAAFLAALPKRLSIGAALGALAFALVMAAFLRHYSLMSELRRALRVRSLTIALQPIMSLGGKNGDGSDFRPPRVAGFECLVRWTREDGTPVSPAVFVPMIESAGLGSELARCVVSTLVSSFGETLRAFPDVYVSLNLASTDIADAKLLDEIERMLAAAHLPPSQIVVELTESRGDESSTAVTEGLRRLRASGHRLSIDDFGTGASNASRLAALSPEIVKVDRSFLLHADTASHAAELLPQLIGMARGLGAKVVIEGVETPEQAALLTGYGDILGQGYYWHRPMPPASAAALLAGALS